MLLAESEGARGQGLGDKKSLPQDQGMLFIFEKTDIYPFWMRDMKFPIDIIWIDSNYEVVDLVKNANPSSYPNSFIPEKQALYVLETNAGWADKNNIQVGSKAMFIWQYLENIEKNKNLIQVDEPNPFDTLNQLGSTVKGQARGNWYFEASFPAKLTDANGKILSNFPIQATGEWMTKEFVLFNKEFYFDETPATKHGVLILEKDNPSGLPEHDNKIEIPVKLK